MRNKIEVRYKQEGVDTRNKFKFIVLYNRRKDWPDRILATRHYLKMEKIYEREMTEEEIRRSESQWRAIAFGYYKAEDLIEDEIHFLGREHPIVQGLIDRFCPDYTARKPQLRLF